MSKAKGTKLHTLPKTEIEQEIASLELYRDNYIKSAKTTIGYVVPQVCNIMGATGHLSAAITRLENAEILIDRRINELRGKSAKEKKQ